eukprot:CAMPEP_0179168980 /NCGR_PEP_ID=MMETSP0796-20121207/83142_1 /TAXON_ID=73915 /ORGANISM="Pyrodinium bahamense, Strain pbaha01" /LENGTH=337 /DNA_ID=CAMNT_0020871773 /DNA_START=307 /DNA_END=1322 /DNA_ORIENTATION=-
MAARQLQDLLPWGVLLQAERALAAASVDASQRTRGKAERTSAARTSAASCSAPSLAASPSVLRRSASLSMVLSRMRSSNCGEAMRPSLPERGRNLWPRGWPVRSGSLKHCEQKSKSSQSKHFMTRPTSGGPAPQPSQVTCGWIAILSASSSSSPASAASAAAAAAERLAALLQLRQLAHAGLVRAQADAGALLASGCAASQAQGRRRARGPTSPAPPEHCRSPWRLVAAAAGGTAGAGERGAAAAARAGAVPMPAAAADPAAAAAAAAAGRGLLGGALAAATALNAAPSHWVWGHDFDATAARPRRPGSAEYARAPGCRRAAETGAPSAPAPWTSLA